MKKMKIKRRNRMIKKRHKTNKKMKKRKNRMIKKKQKKKKKTRRRGRIG